MHLFAQTDEAAGELHREARNQQAHAEYGESEFASSLSCRAAAREHGPAFRDRLPVTDQERKNDGPDDECTASDLQRKADQEIPQRHGSSIALRTAIALPTALPTPLETRRAAAFAR